MKYPMRCEIVDIAGEEIAPDIYPDLVAATPTASKPHIGKHGLAELIFGEVEGNLDMGLVRITLDDGNIIWGHECWWIPLEDK